MKKTFLPLLALLGLSGFLTSCSDSDAESKAEEKPAQVSVSADSLQLSMKQLESVNVDLTGFEDRQLRPVINANGKIKLFPDSRSEVHSEVEGHVDQIYVREGQFVKKGQPLMKLTSGEFLELKNQYITAKSEADFLEIEFNRQAELRKSNVGVLADYQATEAKLNAAIGREKAFKAKLALLDFNATQLNDIRKAVVSPELIIRAPISGSIYKVHQNLGKLATPTDPLVDILNTEQLQANVYVYEKDAELIQVGQKVELTFPNSEIGAVQGTVASVARALDAENGAITLYVNFKRPHTNDIIFSDMNVRAKIVGASERKSSNTLPRTAILDDGEGTYIFGTSQPQAAKIPLRKLKVEIQNEGEDYVQVKVLEKVPNTIKVAYKNILALEAERKKNE
ncbi:efflux RND transporter periplasmic adaptor subunit [Siphonobacter sp.]|uniref:efflux RND transporter periplasmic adaptor subunit n=1 Tax=Siphonobacter sp. TaxID=1869184 RepID=UPI003B3AB207